MPRVTRSSAASVVEDEPMVVPPAADAAAAPRRHDGRRGDSWRNIRGLSRSYGLRWCGDHAPKVAVALRAWRRKGAADHVDDAEGALALEVPVRVYDRTANAVRETTLHEILDQVPLDDETRLPRRLSSSRAEQVELAPTCHVSTLVYHLLCAAWRL